MQAQSILLRQLGRNGPKLPAMGFGLMTLSGGYGTPPPDKERFEILSRAHELGDTFWDTADIYGDNEILLGNWFKHSGKRGDIFLASKFGLISGDGGVHGVDSSGEYCKKACAQSLERLGVESIDLYYAHRLNPETPVEETMRALVALQTEGKIKHIGLCEVSSTALRRAFKIAPVTAVQVEYSPFVRGIETGESQNLLATCRELGVAIVCHSPLGRGLFAGNMTSPESFEVQPGDLRSKMLPWFMPENREANLAIVAEFKRLADKKDITMSQLCLSWILAQGDDFFPIPGTKKIKYLEDNWTAMNTVLAPEEVAEVRKFVEGHEIQGMRTPPSVKHLQYVDTKAEN